MSDTRLYLRATQDQRKLIEQAVAVLRISRSAFILDAVIEQAKNVLLNQTFVRLNDKDF